MDGLQALNCFPLFIRPNNVTGILQYNGIHIHHPLLQLGVLCQCYIPFGTIFFFLLVQRFQGSPHGRNMLFDLVYAMIVRTIKLIEKEGLLAFQFRNIFCQTGDFLR